MNIWDKVDINTFNGIKKGIAPLIISASRSTDIPAFYGPWFMNRLKAGYVKWNNPFNAARPQYISFHKARVIVFWTKNAAPFERFLDELNLYGINYYFTFTINDYEREGFEPNLPSLKERIATFQRLSKKLGKERVVWRYDPLIMTPALDIDVLLKRIKQVGEELVPFTEKLVFSFADIDIYKKVERNMKAHNLEWRMFGLDDMRNFADGLSVVNQEWQLELATCGEEIDLQAYGIHHNSCIDGDLMLRIFPHDKILRKLLTPNAEEPKKEESLFPEAGFQEPNSLGVNRAHKDKGQREACGCVVSKDIGQYNTCPHHCVYCYANFSRKTVNKNYTLANKKKDSESIIPTSDEL